jgi:hypothetical protein
MGHGKQMQTMCTSPRHSAQGFCDMGYRTQLSAAHSGMCLAGAEQELARRDRPLQEEAQRTGGTHTAEERQPHCERLSAFAAGEEEIEAQAYDESQRRGPADLMRHMVASIQHPGVAIGLDAAIAANLRGLKYGR